METKTLQAYSPPGYFDLSIEQTPYTKKIFEWFKNYKVDLQNEANRFDFFYRLFLSVDYTDLVSKDFLNFIAAQYGLADISLPANRMRDLIIYVSSPKEKRLSGNIERLRDFLFNQLWISDFTQAVVGYNSRSRFAETFIIYTNSMTLPATPGNTTYVELEWLAPNTWTKTPSSSTYFCRGYLYEGEIVWCNPLPTNQVVLYSIVSDIPSLPLSPSEGDIAIVTNDGTTDFQSIYYYDGAYWQKNSSPNANQKNVNSVTALQGSEVFAPNDSLITSTTQPPTNGYSEGFGFYGIFGQGILVNKISFQITLTDSGYANLGLIVQLIKKIKPVGNLIIVYAVYNGETFLLEINDINSAN